MLRIMLIGSMFCPPVYFESRATLTQKDVILYKSLKSECGLNNSLNTCLVKFKKVDDNLYSIICGAPGK